MSIPAHRRKKGPLRNALPGPRIQLGIPRCQRCSKLAYPTAAEAEIVRARREHDGPLNVYQCPYENGWHLTSKDWS